jgi:hypothetical protein
MIAVDDHSTIGETFFRAAEKYASSTFLAVPANPTRAYDPAGSEITYGQAAKYSEKLIKMHGKD